MRKYVEMGLLWGVCGGMLISSENKPEKLQDLFHMAVGLVFLLSIVICVCFWLVDTYKEECRKWEAIVDNKNFKMQDLLRLVSTLKKEINNAK